MNDLLQLQTLREVLRQPPRSIFPLRRSKPCPRRLPWYHSLDAKKAADLLQFRPCRLTAGSLVYWRYATQSPEALSQHVPGFVRAALHLMPTIERDAYMEATRSSFTSIESIEQSVVKLLAEEAHSSTVVAQRLFRALQATLETHAAPEAAAFLRALHNGKWLKRHLGPRRRT